MDIIINNSSSNSNNNTFNSSGTNSSSSRSISNSGSTVRGTSTVHTSHSRTSNSDSTSTSSNRNSSSSGSSRGSSSASASAHLPAVDRAPLEVVDADAPPTLPGEKFLSRWPHVKFFLGAPDPHPSGWASLAAFYCYGTAYLSACRLLFVPYRSATWNETDRSNLNALSIPLAWVQRDRLRIRRPFFDSHHLFGVLVPRHMAHMALGPPSVFAAPGNPMDFRIEMLDTSLNDRLCCALHSVLADPDRVARDARLLRNALHTQLVPTHEHYAFVDPDNPHFLHLATQMAYPAKHTPLITPAFLS